MAYSTKTNLTSLILIATPFAYLAYLWNSLPDKVPVHFNYSGEVDRYGSKMALLLIPILLPLLTYLLMRLVPKIDPKDQLKNMGGKYDKITLILVGFMSALSLFIIYTSANPEKMQINLISVLIGALFINLGNFMKTIKENYFVGIRTPWTLEDPEIWKATHKQAGYLMMIGGALLALAPLFVSNRYAMIFLMVVTLSTTLIPAINSYLMHRTK